MKSMTSWVCSAAVLCHWRTGGERGWESPPGDGPQATDRFHIELEGFWQCSGKGINTNQNSPFPPLQRYGALLLTGLPHLWHAACGSRPNRVRSEGKHGSARRNGRVPDSVYDLCSCLCRSRLSMPIPQWSQGSTDLQWGVSYWCSIPSWVNAHDHWCYNPLWFQSFSQSMPLATTMWNPKVESVSTFANKHTAARTAAKTSILIKMNGKTCELVAPSELVWIKP